MAPSKNVAKINFYHNLAQSPLSQEAAAADQFKNQPVQRDLEKHELSFVIQNMSKPKLPAAIAVDLEWQRNGPKNGLNKQKKYNQYHRGTIQEYEQSDGECSHSNGHDEGASKQI